MTVRRIDIIISRNKRQKIREFLKDAAIIDDWEIPLEHERVQIGILLDAGHTEEVMDWFANHFESDVHFRVVLQHVETTLPREEEEEKKKPEEAEEEEKKKEERIGREELYDDISNSANLTRIYIAMVIFSTIVAAIGLIKNNIAVVIGAMVIAPLLGPNVALALSATLGDLKLAKRAARTIVSGIVIAFAVSAIIGIIFRPDPGTNEIASRTTVALSDIGLALVTGAAGSLAFTTGVSSALVGVMVAVALLPPLVVFGLMAGRGSWSYAEGAFLLFLTNLICINLAGVVTFAVQGIHPRTWYEAEKAKKSRRLAIIIWVGLLIVLALIIVLSKNFWEL